VELADCTSPQVVTLAVGDHLVVDPAASNGCIRVGVASAGAEYLIGVVSGAGDETATGISGPYTLTIGNEGQVAAGASGAGGGPAGSGGGLAEAPLDAAARFDRNLRRLEASLVVPPGGAAAPPSGPAVAPPVGEKRTFRVCASDTCSQTNTVNATARSVGAKVAIYTDDENSTFADALTPADLDLLASTFDEYFHPIATEAFGSESDIDNNGVVIVLITRRVNDFTTSCAGGRVIGYFFGGDLLTSFSGSNRAELFFTYAPAPATSQCPTVTRTSAMNALRPTLIHEFQHMISFNQHRLMRDGNQEETWLNEGLSHLAEDLAGELIPNSACPGFASCRSLYASPNVSNTYRYLSDTEKNFLVFGENSSGTLAERGAAFMFTRWVLDQYGTGPNGLALTRSLLATNRVGKGNLEAVTGAPFPVLATRWHLAAYLDDLAGYTDASGLLSFDTWNFRSVMNNPANAQSFPSGFPLLPQVVTQSLTRSGTLRGGTGRSFLLRPGGVVKDILLSAGSGSRNQTDPALVARIGVARIQ